MNKHARLDGKHPASDLPQEVGIGLKPQYYDAVLDTDSHISPPNWLEVHPQNYFGVGAELGGGPPHRWLRAIAEKYPLSFHSVGLSLGSANGLNEHDLEKLAALNEIYAPAVISDHLSFSGNAHDRFADLLPIPYTYESLDHFCAQIDRAQTRLKRPMLIENPSRYLGYKGDEMGEVEFIEQLVTRTGCGIIFDINNVEVSSKNLNLSAEDYVDAIHPNWVGEIHLAGHAREDHDSGPLLIDDHGSHVTDYTWRLFERFMRRAGRKPILIEWDTNVPSYDEIMAEAAKADKIMQNAARKEPAHAAVE